jgi:ferredoxin
LGALYGFFCRLALLGVKLDKTKCTDCGMCIAVCKMDTKRVGDHECVHCGDCISVCPTKAITWKGSKLFVKANEPDAPVATEFKPLSAMLKTAPVEEEKPTEVQDEDK